jgi:hypothetical protein
VRISPKYIQLVGDAIIPLGGFFFWDWGLYFILLFYLLDMIASEVIIHFKSRKSIEYYGKGKKERFSFGIQSALMLLVSVISIHAAMSFIQPGIDFKQELIDFWTYEELGMQQGYLLAPFIAYGAYLQYKTSFLMPAKFRTLIHAEIWKAHLRAFLLIVAASGIALGVSQVVELSQMIYVLVIVATSSSYQFYFNN